VLALDVITVGPVGHSYTSGAFLFMV